MKTTHMFRSTIFFVTIFLVTSGLIFAENHNSSRSNRTNKHEGEGGDGKGDVIMVYPERISTETIGEILDEIDPPNSGERTVGKSLRKARPIQPNENQVRDLLKKYKVTGINKIIIESGKNVPWRIIILSSPINEVAARKVMDRADVAVKEKGVKE